MWAAAFYPFICKGCAMEPIEQQDKETSDALTISAEKTFFIIVKAREFDEKVAPSDPGSGSNPSDDKEVDVLEAGDDATLQELAAVLTGSMKTSS